MLKALKMREHDEVVQDSKDVQKMDHIFEDFEESDDESVDELEELVRSRSNIERIEAASLQYHEQAQVLIERLQLAQDPDVIERSMLNYVVNLHQERFYGCVSLPFSLAMFGFFALAAYLHEDITNVYMIESGLRKVLGRNLTAVDDIPGLWHWIRSETLVPELFKQGKIKGATGPEKASWSRVLAYNQLQGPLVLEQARSEKTLCIDDAVSDMLCYPQKSRSTAAYGRNVSIAIATPNSGEYTGGNVTLAERKAYYESSFRPVAATRRLRTMRTEYMAWVSAGSKNDDDTYRAFIYPNTPRKQIDEHFNYLHHRGWLDIQTKEVKVKALLLNAEVGRPRLEQYSVLIRFSRGGGIFTRLTMDSLFLEFAAGSASMSTDFCWVLCLIIMTFLEGRSLWRSALLYSKNRMFKHLPQTNARRQASGFSKAKGSSTFWVLLQWTIIICGWFCAMGFFYQNTMRKAVVSKLKAVIAKQKADIPAEVSEGQELFDATDIMLYFSSWLRLLLADYHLILMFRFFASFRAQARLGVVVSTLEASVVDIVHFLIVLMPTFMAYAISGCFIFGRRMESFATFDGAIGICFKMIMEGEYDWPELSTEHFWTAALWTWTFMLLIVLLMLNMVLAIVMDVYGEMRKNAGNSETVWSSFKNFMGRLYHWRRWVSNKTLHSFLPDTGGTISRSEMLEDFPGMCDRQLNELFLACKSESSTTHEADHQITMRMILSSKLAVDEIHEEIHQLYEAHDAAMFPPAVDIPSINREEPVTGWLQYVSKQMAAQNHFMLKAQWQLQQLQWKWQSIEAMHGADVNFFNVIQNDTAPVANQEVI